MESAYVEPFKNSLEAVVANGEGYIFIFGTLHAEIFNGSEHEALFITHAGVEISILQHEGEHELLHAVPVGLMTKCSGVASKCP